MNGCMMVKQVLHVVSHLKDVPQTGAIAKRMGEEWNLYEIVGDEASTFWGLGMRPPGYLPCPRELSFSVLGPIWKECIQEIPQIISLPDIPGLSITDWSKALRNQNEGHFAHPSDLQRTHLHLHNVTIPGGLFTTEEMIYPELWKLLAALGPVTVKVGDNGFARATRLDFFIKACIPCLFLLIVGPGTVLPYVFKGSKGRYLTYHVACNECVLTNCVPISSPNRRNLPTMFFLVMQPPYVLLPVEVEDPWYANYGYQLALELQAQVKRVKRFLGLLLAGITVLVSLIATATISTVALSQ